MCAFALPSDILQCVCVSDRAVVTLGHALCAVLSFTQL
jgi:hypothetical protein